LDYNGDTEREVEPLSTHHRTPSRMRLQHVSLPIPANSQDKVRKFYGEVLGLVEKPLPPMFEPNRVVWFAMGENELELHFIPDAVLPNPVEQRHFCLAVDDLSDVRKQLSAAGYEVWDGSPIPNRPRIFCRDPFGNLIEFVTILGDYLESGE